MFTILRKIMITTVMLFLASCSAFHETLMVPPGHDINRHCISSKGGGLPGCKNYRFLPADKYKAAKKKEPKVIQDYQQYKGKKI